MRLHRFFIQPQKNFTEEKFLRGKHKIGDAIEISEERIVHQLRKVLRLGVGDKIIIFDGSGLDYTSEILELDNENCKLKIENSNTTFIPNKNVVLFMSVIKKENFELVCEKACELGVTKIVPVVTQRTLQKNLNRERIEKILIEASEQCRRGDVPTFGEEMKLEDVLNEENLLGCDMDGVSLKHLSLTTYNLQLSLLIGPEGGWSEEERKLFKEKNLKIVSLGETILRAETAAIVAVAFALN